VKPLITLLVGIILLAPAAYGQSDRAQQITITSRPPGCTVYLSGEYELVTTAPNTINEDLEGVYTVRAMRPGYEDWKSTVVFTPGTAQDVRIILTPKTRYRAALRSMFIPGWGQYYAGEKTRGFFWGGAIIASGVLGVIYETRYQDRKSDWEDAVTRFEQATTFDEKERLRDEALRLKQRAYDAENDRRLVWGIMGGVWAVNFLDALILFPTEDRFADLPLTLQPTPDGSGSMITFTLTF
jgi:hypothetical protein